MPARTPLPPQAKTVAYSTRHMRQETLDRLRTLAVRLHTTLEDVVNRCLVLGAIQEETRLRTARDAVRR